MAGNFTEVLAAYTDITGPPFMVPIYGLGLGDSDCYHNERHGNSTQLVLTVADQYRERDFPGAWFLPNDGYDPALNCSLESALTHSYFYSGRVVAMPLAKRYPAQIWLRVRRITYIFSEGLCRFRYCCGGTTQTWLLHRAVVVHGSAQHHTGSRRIGSPNWQDRCRLDWRWIQGGFYA